ncbi:alpha/beta hydrolase family protein [Flavilitoribacter nigricans]|uniref:Peptidase S9 family protein n=1 Tax=Flavilitoribacter nigricans (strain ATCC 23147 / DSM 23189 / NBRC 102662 / NCIMB 1420 / SS-2) TaxID=1122177 RepID=A0A2D0N9W2_FLAN2|nr:S9 family peptidase [Flavilitoribacter nigricans]PHN05160.1 peptidase S9 family protein [Flavilitoribacter nigricans DSM 23189 = NBRC 102662]
MMKPLYIFLLTVLCIPFSGQAQTEKLELMDIFDLEFISDPQISPDGSQIVYVRNFKDVMADANRSNLWIVNADGSKNRPLTTGNQSDYSPRWSPDGSRVLYLSSKGGSSQMYLRWLEDGTEQKLSNFPKSPGGIQWSPDGKWIAFGMSVDSQPASLMSLPSPPKGAKWTEKPKYIDELNYRSDGAGYLPASYRHLFVMSADGGHPRQLTSGDFDHGSAFAWTPDGKYLILSANRHPEGEYEPRNSEIYELEVASGTIKALTDRNGPDSSPVVSPDGKTIVYSGFDDRYQGFQTTGVYLMNRDGSNPRLINKDFDRNSDNLQWSADGKYLFFQYDDRGNTKIARMDLQGKVTDLTNNVGGLSLGRPYSGGDYTVAKNGRFAYTLGTPEHPSDLAVATGSGDVKRLTEVNADLFSHKKVGAVEEIWYESSFDGRKVQGWICKPPDFDPNKKYPLLLEIHGGPFTNYGWRFSTEVQLYAAAGYVVLYTNPRGSTSYGEEFANLIHHNYPGEDYDDLISGVDAVIEKGYIDENQLYVTGGSGGGVLSAWIIGKTDRFRAAVVAKPVINWSSFVLHADGPAFFSKYWFPGFPWENPEQYWKRSPLSLAGNVKTPTMLLTGEQDYRTPISETEQYYAALKLNKVDAAMVRIQDSGHGIANKPSNLMNKVAYVLGWFDKHQPVKP